ncbi:hypothetical protein ACFU8W_32930 [Streptomyces sp. NPDC057565]|uniref:hypothetical protein n=1 Tax=Streptomyces sp. NPDC057565 TaxID=3346169 RepID=UPI003678C96E
MSALVAMIRCTRRRIAPSFAGQARGDVTEVDLRLMAGQVGLWDERLQWRLA